MGIMSPEYAWWAAIGGFILSAVMMICACCLCDTWLISDTFYVSWVFFFACCVFLFLPEGGTFLKKWAFFCSMMLKFTTQTYDLQPTKKAMAPIGKTDLSPP